MKANGRRAGSLSSGVAWEWSAKGNPFVAAGPPIGSCFPKLLSARISAIEAHGYCLLCVMTKWFPFVKGQSAVGALNG